MNETDNRDNCRSWETLNYAIHTGLLVARSSRGAFYLMFFRQL